jgi:hypothetical protein
MLRVVFAIFGTVNSIRQWSHSSTVCNSLKKKYKKEILDSVCPTSMTCFVLNSDKSKYNLNLINRMEKGFIEDTKTNNKYSIK